MSAAPVSRNALCPCGSGQKYKRCCLAEQERCVREARLDDEVGRRIQAWASRHLGSEIDEALTEFFGQGSALDAVDMQLFATWFHDDRELAGGGTPAERYAARAELPPEERKAAARIAAARLGLYRVVSVEPGRALTLEPLAGGDRFEVRSPHVSREAVQWDLLLARVMPGDPLSLWGPARTFQPCDEAELLEEIARLEGAPPAELNQAEAASALRRHAAELIRFQPERLRVGPTFFTLEGGPVVAATATWHVLDVRAATERLRALGGLDPGEAVEIDLTMPRAALVAGRPALPPGAHVLESSPIGAPDVIQVASLRLEGGHLIAEAISEERIAGAVETVAADLGELVELADLRVEPLDAAQPSGRRPDGPARPKRMRERMLLAEATAARMRLWLDEPHAGLGGRTPREAAQAGDRAGVVALMRQLENNAERASRRGEPPIDVAALRAELGLGDELAA